MKILITGSTGFVGKNLVPKLVNAGYKLLLPTRNELDLLDQRQTANYFDNWKFDTIIHLAAVCGGIGANSKRPYSFIADNLEMNLNLFNYAIDNHIEKVVTLGSVCAYPKFAPIPFVEEDIWKGKPEETNAPYGESKRALMLMCDTANQQFNLNAVHLIPTNLYGRYDNFNPQTSHVIPALIKKIQHAIDNNEESVEVWGTGLASRDFLHVNDLCTAVMISLESYNSYEPLNLGSGEDIRIKELVTLLCDIMSYSGRVEWNKDKPDGQPKRQLDITKARKELGWNPLIELREGLTDLVNWYRYNNDKIC